MNTQGNRDAVASHGIGQRPGRGKALTGVVTSALAIAVSVLVAVFFVRYANKTQECYQPDSFQQYKQCVRQQLTGN
ncbi:hypothetical protein SNS2_3915 [Streptomyces netropsis]|nr:hypothetical protein SNS2_3915 [Streptomyces netropsis]